MADVKNAMAETQVSGSAPSGKRSKAEPANDAAPEADSTPPTPTPEPDATPAPAEEPDPAAAAAPDGSPEDYLDSMRAFLADEGFDDTGLDPSASAGSSTTAPLPSTNKTPTGSTEPANPFNPETNPVSHGAKQRLIKKGRPGVSPGVAPAIADFAYRNYPNLMAAGAGTAGILGIRELMKMTATPEPNPDGATADADVQQRSRDAAAAAVEMFRQRYGEGSRDPSPNPYQAQRDYQKKNPQSMNPNEL
jgi:hypothetical protein